MSTFVDNNRTDYGSGRDYNIVVDIHLGGRWSLDDEIQRELSFVCGVTRVEAMRNPT